MVRAGDRLEASFRGNVQCVDVRPRLTAVFTTNLDTTMHMQIVQHDVFVQKSYNVYRGFVQLRKVTKIPLAPPAADKSKPLAGGAPPAAVAAPPPPPPAAEPAQDGEAAGTGGAEAEAATAPTEAVAVEEPPAPTFEIKYIMLEELLITFPKVGVTYC